jgi:hypothetical protein
VILRQSSRYAALTARIAAGSADSRWYTRRGHPTSSGGLVTLIACWVWIPSGGLLVLALSNGYTDGNGGGDGGQASPAIDYGKLESAMTNAGETEADRRSADAMERIAATQERGNRVQELDSLLARFPALPDGAIKTMVEQRIGELFAASATPPAPTPAAPGLSDTENVQDAVGEAKGGAE